MSILGKVFKRKKESAIMTEEKESTADVSADEPKGISQDGDAKKKPGKTISGVVVRPHVTEKSANAGGENKYIFVVSQGSNKQLIKRAVEGRYGVSVKKVAVLTMPDKKRMRGRQIGWRKGFKKAIVTLKEGQTIELQ